MSAPPAPINSLWIGRPLSLIERLCIQSFLDHGHEFILHTYGPVEGVPKGTTIADGREIVPESEIFAAEGEFGKGSYAPFADLFRIELLRQRGGWWVDMDVVCLRPLDPPQANIVATSEEGEWGILPNINVLRFEAGHPLLTKAASLWGTADRSDFTYGLKIFKKGLEAHPEGVYMAPPEWFNPVQWIYTKYIVQPEEGWWHPRRLKRTLGLTRALGRVTPASYTLHLWNEIWRQKGLERDAAHHPESLIEILKRKHGIR